MKKNLSHILFYDNKKTLGWSWLKLFFLAFLCLNCNTPLPAQEESPFEELTILEEDISILETDKLGQIYTYTNEGEVLKFDANGKQLFEYTNFNLGDLKTIDATDPFNLLLYFADYGEIVTLNRTLNESGAFNLLDLGYQDVAVVGMSNDNNIWLYDPNDYKLKKINRLGELIVESIPLINEYADIAPDFLIERGNQVYLNDPKKGVLLFDVFGKYLKTYKNLKGLGAFQIVDDRILYQKESRFLSFDLLTAKTKSIDLPKALEENTKVYLQRKRLYLLEETKLKIFKF